MKINSDKFNDALVGVQNAKSLLEYAEQDLQPFSGEKYISTDDEYEKLTSAIRRLSIARDGIRSSLNNLLSMNVEKEHGA